MNNKEKQILSKLIALADKQQKILVRLAQAAQDTPEALTSYLKNTWMTAALNSGVTGATPTVKYTPGSQTATGETIGDNYMVTGECPVAAREKMLRQFKAQIASQKPDLDGKVSTIFQDPTTPQPV